MHRMHVINVKEVFKPFERRQEAHEWKDRHAEPAVGGWGIK